MNGIQNSNPLQIPNADEMAETEPDLGNGIGIAEAGKVEAVEVARGENGGQRLAGWKWKTTNEVASCSRDRDHEAHPEGEGTEAARPRANPGVRTGGGTTSSRPP